MQVTPCPYTMISLELGSLKSRALFAISSAVSAVPHATTALEGRGRKEGNRGGGGGGGERILHSERVA